MCMASYLFLQFSLATMITWPTPNTRLQDYVGYKSLHVVHCIVYLHPEVCTVVHKLPHSFCCIISHTRSEHLTQFLKIYTPCGDAKLWLNFS